MPPNDLSVTLAYFFLTRMVAEVLVRFENHLPVWVVEYDFELPQCLRPDGPRHARGGENARSILGKLREWHRYTNPPSLTADTWPRRALTSPPTATTLGSLIVSCADRNSGFASLKSFVS